MAPNSEQSLTREWGASGECLSWLQSSAVRQKPFGKILEIQNSASRAPFGAPHLRVPVDKIAR